VLWTFGGVGDGIFPQASLLQKGGKLYGTTFEGGTFGGTSRSGGTVFKLAPPAPGSTAWLERVLWSFGRRDDGASLEGNLISVGGNFYGTTYGGGATGDGTVFEVTP
jgi:uncharacterized repeat protein (TIGR03803 family)